MKSLLIKICLFNFLLIFWFDMCAQSDSLKIDSLKKLLAIQKDDTNRVNTLNELGRQFLKKDDYKNGEQCTNDALWLAKKLNFKKGQAIAYGFKADAAATLEETWPYLDSAIQSAKESKDPPIIYLSYLVKGQLCRSTDKYNEALYCFLEAVKIAELMRDKSNTAWAYQEVAGVYLKLGNSKELLRNYKIALILFSELNSNSDVALCYLGIGDDYYNKGNYDSAEYYLTKGLLSVYKPSSNKISSFTPDEVKGFLLLDIGKVYEMKAAMENNKENANELYHESEKNYLEARLVGEGDRSSTLLQDVYLGLGSLYLRKNKLSDSKRYLDKAFQIFKERESKKDLKEVYLKYSIYDSAIGNYKKAYEDHKMYMQYFEEIQQDSSIRKAAQIQDQFEYDKKEALAKAEQEKKDAEAKRIKNQQYFVIAALGIVVLAVVIIAAIQYRSNKHKQRANALLQQQKEKVETTLLELKSTQAQLIQSEKMASLGELTAGIAHEIQNPLNFVNNFSDVNKELLAEMKDEMDKGNLDDARSIANDVIENEEKINHHGKRADGIVKGMLQHSRTSSGQKESMDVNALADEYLRLAYHGLRAKDKSFNAEIKSDLDPSIGKINIVPQEIGRVLLNLINNAFYAVNEKAKLGTPNYEPRVIVSTKKLDGKVVITVKDNGNGISSKVLDKIFQPFFTTKPAGQGTGLGLSLAYDIIRAHGGDIKVETKEGEGSEFTIYLPT